MKGYHNKVNTLAGSKNKTEVSLVINLFQSVLDGFIRGELKRMESEPTKVKLHYNEQQVLTMKSGPHFSILVSFRRPRPQRRGRKRTNV